MNDTSTVKYGFETETTFIFPVPIPCSPEQVPATKGRIIPSRDEENL